MDMAHFPCCNCLDENPTSCRSALLIYFENIQYGSQAHFAIYSNSYCFTFIIVNATVDSSIISGMYDNLIE